MTKDRGRLAIHPFIALDESLAGGRTMDDCMIVGISGNCGSDCPVFRRGECEEPEDIEDTEGLYSSDVAEGGAE